VQNGEKYPLYSHPVLRIQACFHVGLQTCRSPPVSLLRPFLTVLHIPGMMRGEHYSPQDHNCQQLSERWETGGPGPISGINIDQQCNGWWAEGCPLTIVQRSDGRKRIHPSAQHCLS